MGYLIKYYFKERYFSKGYIKQNFKISMQNDLVLMIVILRLKVGGERDCDCLFNRVFRKQYLIIIFFSGFDKWIFV